MEKRPGSAPYLGATSLCHLYSIPFLLLTLQPTKSCSHSMPVPSVATSDCALQSQICHFLQCLLVNCQPPALPLCNQTGISSVPNRAAHPSKAKIIGTFMGISTFNPYVRVFVAWVKGRGALVLVCLLLQLHFSSFFLSFYLFLCFRLPSSFTIFVRRGSIL